uniref:LysR family transcriptional regulator n=1 Tax=Marinobacterium profundum TaxID=1714300 RepID=UPI0009EC04AC|nr:LysR family transcriptional regulator [Marinobacterium profundum]
MIPPQLSLFRTVIVAGNFSSAARQLGISAAAVSKAIAQLEKNLGLRLFHRTTHSLTLTQDGQKLAERVMPLLDELEQQLTLSTDTQQAACGRLKVNLPGSFGRRLILPLLPAFQQRYPDIELDLHFDDRIRDLVGEGFDIGIGNGVHEDSQLIARPLPPQSWVTVASQDYLAAHPVPLHPNALAQHRCIGYRSPTSGRIQPWSYRVAGKSAKVMPCGGPTVTTVEATLDAARLGMGIALLGLWHAAADIRSGILVPLLDSFAPPPVPIWIYYSSRNYLPARTRLLIDHLLTTFPDHARTVSLLPANRAATPQTTTTPVSGASQ